MKIKKIALTLSLLCFVLLCIGCVYATQADSNLTSDDMNQPLEVDNKINEIKENSSSADIPSQTTNNNQKTNSAKTEKIKPDVLCDQGFPHKKSNTFKIKVYNVDDNTGKITYHKNVKLIVKVKIGKKTKIFNVKTNKKGDAKVFNVKKLKIGKYKVTVTTTDEKYQIKEKGIIIIYGKAKKSTTIKLKKGKYGIEGSKKLKKGDVASSFYEPKNGQIDKGVYADISNGKDPLNKYPHSMSIKAKFFFKNKKTGKIISKISKLTPNKFYGWKLLKVKPIKGYTPIKTKIWYLTL